MKHRFAVRVGPVGFRIGSDWRAPVAALETLYAGYPAPDVPDFTVRLAAARPWRRWVRPAVTVGGDHWLPGTAPLPLAHGLLAAEMGMNLQVALGCRRFLLLHAGMAERGGRALVMAGESGSGKSTLAALLGLRGWRFLADEFALVAPATGLVHPFPRPASLKNAGIAAVAAEMPPALNGARWGPLLAGTPKGDVRHLAAPADAVARMDEPAAPALILFPRFGLPPARRPVGAAEAFARLTQASTNYPGLGEPGFDALNRLVRGALAFAIDYPDTGAALAAVEELAAEAGC